MLIIDKEWLKVAAYPSTKYLASYVEDMSYDIINDEIISIPLMECKVTLYLRDMSYIFVRDDVNKIKIDHLSNYTEEPDKVTLEIDPNEKINYKEVEKELSKDETDYSDFETNIAVKEKERFDMLELDEEG